MERHRQRPSVLAEQSLQRVPTRTRRVAHQAAAPCVVDRNSRCKARPKTITCHREKGIRSHHSNQQYSVIALTDGSGAIAERYPYSAYGEPVFVSATGTVLTSSEKDNRYTHTGREWDEELILYHFRARMYDAESGRFCRRDPLRYSDGVHLYSNNFKLIGSDPSGGISVMLVTGGAELNPIPCNISNVIDWQVRMDFQLDADAPCDGYFVQKVTIVCETERCPCGDAKINKKSTRFSYFEAKPISAGTPAGTVVFPDHINPPPSLSSSQCFQYKQTGIARFYCKTVTGDLDSLWKSGSVIYGENTPCMTAGGRYQLIPNQYWHNGFGNYVESKRRHDVTLISGGVVVESPLTR